MLGLSILLRIVARGVSGLLSRGAASAGPKLATVVARMGSQGRAQIALILKNQLPRFQNTRMTVDQMIAAIQRGWDGLSSFEQVAIVLTIASASQEPIQMALRQLGFDDATILEATELLRSAMRDQVIDADNDGELTPEEYHRLNEAAGLLESVFGRGESAILFLRAVKLWMDYPIHMSRAISPRNPSFDLPKIER